MDIPERAGQKRPVLGRESFLAEELEILHKLNNKLGIILGECALVAQDTNDPKFLTRVQTIEIIAQSIGDEIASRQSKIAEIMRAEAETKAS